MERRIGVIFGNGTGATLSGALLSARPQHRSLRFRGNLDLDPRFPSRSSLSTSEVRPAPPAVAVRVRQSIKDLIDYVIIDFDTFEGQHQNVERARIKGVELGYSYANDGWRARAELTLQDPAMEPPTSPAAPLTRSPAIAGVRE